MGSNINLNFLNSPGTQSTESLADRLGSHFRTTNFNRPPQEYLPNTALNAILSQEEIQKEFDKFENDLALFQKTSKERYEGLKVYDRPYREDLGTWILANAPKIFVVTLQCGLEPYVLVLAMSFFREKGLTDERLRDVDPFSHRDIFPPQLWSNYKLHEFCTKRWRLLVEEFSPKKYDYDLASDSILPFTLLRTMHRAGAFSSVHRIQIHKDYNSHANLGDIALKELNIRSDDDIKAEDAWDVEARALKAVNKIDHPHIVKCIAAIRKGENRYFMFPWAQGNSLRDFWNQNPKKRLSPGGLRHIISQLKGIADALVQLHNYDDSRDQSMGETLALQVPSVNGSNANGPTAAHTDYADDDEHESNGKKSQSIRHIRHGDLKPENILNFTDSGSRLGVLKVADLGIAKQHVLKTADRNAMRLVTTTRFGTQSYEAPETVTAKYGRSRLYDIWSMGCITLEFIIWILYGNEQLNNFYIQLSGGTQLSYQYYEIRDPEQPGHAEVHRVVLKWINHIRETDPECQQESAIRDLLDIVAENLLVVALPPSSASSRTGGRTLPLPPIDGRQKFRATATEFREALASILAKADKETYSNYLCTGNDRRHAQTPASMLSPVSGQQIGSEKASPTQMAITTGIRGQTIRSNYFLPPLREWRFPVDNVLAGMITAKIGHDAFKPTIMTTRSLCARCLKLDFWTGGFSIDDTIQNLSVTMLKCDFCKMLHKACPKEDELAPDIVRFERKESNLCLTGDPYPVLSIVRAPQARTTHLFQIGFPQLPAPGTEAFYNVLESWLEDCETNHNDPNSQDRDCSATPKERLPTRLIDVGTLNAPTLRLVDTKDEKLGLNERYIALSHPWGDTKKYTPFSTMIQDPMGTGHEIENFKRAIPYDELPATFKDAVICTRRLKIQYLWIDSICIIQGKGGDFHLEAERMESVFSGAHCVLAASRAKDQRDGFLRPRRQRNYVRFQPDKDEPFFVCEPIDNFNKDVIDGALNKRGWVLQERALARRTIYFTETQTYFECGYGVRCETLTRMHNTMAELLGDPRFPNKAMRTNSRALKIEYFQGLYRQYSRLNFTSYADRPFAIAGLEKRLRDAFDTKGGFGIFDDGDRGSAENGLFHRSLLWKRSEEDDETRETVGMDKEPKIYWLEPIHFPTEREILVPTWSWMAYKGAIDYSDPEYQTADWETEEIIPPWTKGSFQGCPAITAVIRDFNVAGGRPTEYHLTYDHDRSEMSHQRVQCVIVARSKQPQEMKAKQIFVLLVTATTETTPDGRKIYRRAGVGVMLGKFITLDGPVIPASVV